MHLSFNLLARQKLGWVWYDVMFDFGCAGVRFDFNHSSSSAEDVDIFFLPPIWSSEDNTATVSWLGTWRILLVGSLLGMQSDCNDARNYVITLWYNRAKHKRTRSCVTTSRDAEHNTREQKTQLKRTKGEANGRFDLKLCTVRDGWRLGLKLIPHYLNRVPIWL